MGVVPRARRPSDAFGARARRRCERVIDEPALEALDVSWSPYPEFERHEQRGVFIGRELQPYSATRATVLIAADARGGVRFVYVDHDGGAAAAAGRLEVECAPPLPPAVAAAATAGGSL